MLITIISLRSPPGIVTQPQGYTSGKPITRVCTLQEKAKQTPTHNLLCVNLPTLKSYPKHKT